MSDKSCNKYPKISHIIFDLDGTLIDTELWGFNNANIILSKHGKQCSLQTYSKLIGMNTIDRAQALIDQFELPDYSKETFHGEWVNECMKHLKDIQLMPGVEPLLDNLKKSGIPLAIATVGKKIEFIAKTSHLSNIFEEGKYFRHIIHGDDERLQRLKPFPDIYNLCNSQFQPTPDPKNVLVFEDNSVGIEAAVGAGMTSVLVNDQRFSDTKESKADLIIQGFKEFKPELFGLPAFQ